MITSDFGLIINNYVGHYSIITSEGIELIVSEEFHPAEGNEKELEMKSVLKTDFRDSNYLLLKFANINIYNDSEILSFCNKYGLPHSSSMIDDEKPISDSEENIKTCLKLTNFSRQDTIEKFEFCRYVCYAKWLINIKNEIDNNSPNYVNLLENLLSLSLFSRLYTVDFRKKYYVEPETEMFRFQYCYLFFFYLYIISRKKFDFKGSLEYVLPKYNAIIISTNNDPIHIQRYFNNPFEKNLYNLLCNIRDSDFIDSIVMDQYGAVKIAKKDVVLSDKIIELIKIIAPMVYCDYVTETLNIVHPKLVINNKTTNFNKTTNEFSLDWKINYLFTGLIMELLILTTANNQISKCANPKCYKFFSRDNYSRKKYCCHECAVSFAKQKQRLLDKTNPNRKRNKPQFQDKKKKQ